MKQITEVGVVTAESFRNDILLRSEPVVFRGLVKQWPLVAAFNEGSDSFLRYLMQYDKGTMVSSVQGPPSIRGRIFYNQDLSGLNCQAGQISLRDALEYILSLVGDDLPPTLAIQSVAVTDVLPGLEIANTMPLLPGSVVPRIWIGGKATVAAHYDPMENIACCVAGKRRFTLFPPEQVENLYPGPFEVTPAGATVSMVDFDNVDHNKYPRFREALSVAMTADLAPGDALYIPYLWWHHVRALDDLNVLVNYWWTESEQKHGDPRNAMFYAMLTLQSLPPSYRKAWQSHFNHYVFHDSGHPGAHLPSERRGILDGFNLEIIKRLKQALIKTLTR